MLDAVCVVPKGVGEHEFLIVDGHGVLSALDLQPVTNQHAT